MTHISLSERTALALVVTTAFLSGTLSLLSVATSPLFAMSTAGGTLTFPGVEPSVGGPMLAQAALHAAAPAMPQDMLIERVTLGILLILLGYALHAVVAAHDRRFARARKHR